MGLINTALQVGRSALLSYQSALQIIGNNISNVGSPDYTRQTPGLTPINGPSLPEGMRPGAGVALTSLKRHLDESLENRIRSASGENEALVTRTGAMGLVETLFDPVSGLRLSDRLGDFFNQMDEVQNNPADSATRQLALSGASSLAAALRQLRSSLADLGASFDEQIGALVETANDLSRRIGVLNTEIVSTEASGSPASALRDQRDALLRQLSEIVDVSVRVQPNGSVNVLVGNEVLVQGGVNRGLKVVVGTDGEFRRSSIAFADNNSQVAQPGGRLSGLITARDEDAFGRIVDIDRLAGAIIFEVNRVHSDGQGQVGYSSLTSSYSVRDTSAALSSADASLPFDPVNGSFFIAVTDDTTGALNSYQIEIDLDGIGDDDTTLESLAANITENVVGVTAEITVDNRLSLSADAGKSFTFGHDGQTQRTDTSGILAALGINTLFSGESAADIAVNESLLTQPSLLAAAAVSLSGDGANAGRLSSVAHTASDLLEGVSVMDFYASVASDVAVTAAGVRDGAEGSSSILRSLQVQKESISGVSLDEETIQLLKFERAFQGAARFVSVVDRLVAEMIALVR